MASDLTKAARIADVERIASETKDLAMQLFNEGHLVVTFNQADRVIELLPDGGVPCPNCGADLASVTGQLRALADMLRDNPNPYSTLISAVRIGTASQALPCHHGGHTCPACGVGSEVLVQLVL